MNRPDDHFDDLEHRLRSHFDRRADEFRLPPRSWVTPAVQTSSRRPAATWLVAASLVVLVAGGAAVLRSRHAGNDSVSSPPTHALPVVGDTTTGADSAGVETTDSAASEGLDPALPCEPVPTDETIHFLPNDVRLVTVLPTATPDGYCVSDHAVSTLMGEGDSGTTVWSSCMDCTAPDASVAVIAVGPEAEARLEPGRTPTLNAVVVQEQTAHYYAPSVEYQAGLVGPAVSRLYVADVVVVGWGLDEGDFIDFADEAVAFERGLRSGGSDESTGEIAGLEIVYDGWLGSFVPGQVPLHAQLSVQYHSATTDGDALIYEVARFVDEAPPLAAYQFALPGARFVEGEGGHALAFAPYDRAGPEPLITAVVAVDEGYTALWTAGEPWWTAEELNEIDLTPADLTDPRWVEIAYESGQYDAVG